MLKGQKEVQMVDKSTWQQVDNLHGLMDIAFGPLTRGGSNTKPRSLTITQVSTGSYKYYITMVGTQIEHIL